MVYDKWFEDWQDLPLETTPITADFLEHVETALDGQDNRIVTLESGTPGHTIRDEGSALTQRPSLNFTGSGVTVTDNSVNNRTDVSIGSGGGGHTIQDEGSALTQRAGLNFLGSGVTAVDDSANNRTNVTIPGGSSGTSYTGHIILDEGSKATGGTAINNAIAALPAGGGTIYIPAGVWTVDTPILINKNGVTLQGMSVIATELQYAPGTVSTVIANSSTTQRIVHIRDILIDPSGASGGTAINASYFVNSTFERIRIGEGTTRPLRGIVFDGLGTYYNTVRDVRINVIGVGSVGMLFDNNANANTVYNARILGDANTVGLSIGVASGIAHTNTFVLIDCEATMGIGIQVGGYNTTLVGPYIEAVTTGIQIESGVEAFACFGGMVAGCTTNINDLGADAPTWYGVWNQYATYTSIPVRLNPSTGTEEIRISGRKPTAGAPTSGSWRTGSLILDSNKTWWYCTAGGSPGTWA